MDINKMDVKTNVKPNEANSSKFGLANNHLTKASDEYKNKTASLIEYFSISTKKTWATMSIEETFTSDNDDYMYAEVLLVLNL